MIKITLIEPNREQPRKNFDEDALLELADSAAIASAKLRGERQLAVVNNLEDSTDPNVRNSKYKA